MKLMNCGSTKQQTSKPISSVKTKHVTTTPPISSCIM